MNSLTRLFHPLRHPIFARLYAAQAINLIGDALTWLGLALLAYELVADQASVILSGALTLRVATYVIFSPLAGSIADRMDRKTIMMVTHLARMVIVCLFPFVTHGWQIYAIVLALNLFSAFFTPTYTATIPLVTTEKDYTIAISLSSATYQLLGVLGPGLAGSVATLMGTRTVFWLDGITFLIAAFLVWTLPRQLLVQDNREPKSISRTLTDIKTGTACLFNDPCIRYALFMQLVAAIVGASILVNTVEFVQGSLQLGKQEYGWSMAAFGIGATLASISLGILKQNLKKTMIISMGTVLMSLALFPANWVGLWGVLILWSVAGAGQSLVNVPTQTLIADRVSVDVQGRIYGAHFAWSHLWWVFSYPLAGWLGNHTPNLVFMSTGLTSAVILGVVHLVLQPRQLLELKSGLWHEHEHTHDVHHHHAHKLSQTAHESHSHLHWHDSVHLNM